MAKQVTKKAPIKKMAVKSPSASSKMPVKNMKIKSDTVFTPKVKRSAAILEDARDIATSYAVFQGMIGAAKLANKLKKK